MKIVKDHIDDDLYIDILLSEEEIEEIFHSMLYLKPFQIGKHVFNLAIRQYMGEEDAVDEE